MRAVLMNPVACSALLIFLIASPAFALSVDEVSRSVLVSTFVDSSGLFTDVDSEGIESGLLGRFFEASVDGTGFGDFTNATGEALQESEILITPNGGLFLDAAGSAGSVFDVKDPGFRSRAELSADSQLSITFTLEEDRSFVFASSLSAELSQLTLFEPTGGVRSDVIVLARLSGLATGIVIDREIRDDTENDGGVLDRFTLEGTLEADTYLLEILAITDLGGFEDAAGFGVAGFGVQLTVIPEPGTALLLGLGLLALAGRDNRQSLGKQSSRSPLTSVERHESFIDLEMPLGRERIE